MSTLATLNVVLNGDISGFMKSLKDAETQSKRSSSVISTALSAIGTAAKVAGAVAVAGIGAVAAGLTVAVKEAADAEKNLAQLDAVLKSTGGAAGVTRDSVLQLAGALQKTTTFSDDEIIAADNLLLTFTQIGKDVFPEATRAVLDMSVALGQDAKSSALQLGKALNDPIKGVTALRKVGVSFTEAQMKQIKAMAAAGDVAGAQTLILKELQKEFGGSAEAAGKTLSGSLTILKNAGLDILETIGTALVPVLTQLAQGLRDALDNPAVQAGIQAIMDSLNQFVTVVLPQIIAGLQGVVNWIQTNWPAVQRGLVGAFEQARAFIEPVVNSIRTVIESVLTTIKTFINTHGNEIKTFFSTTWSGIRNIVETVVNIISTIINEVLSGIRNFINDNQAGIQLVFSTVWETIKIIVGSAVDAVRGVVNAILALLRGDVQGALTAIQGIFTGIWERIKGVVAQAAQSARMILVLAWDFLRKKAAEIWNGIKTAIENAINGAINFLRGTVEWFIQAGRNIIEGIVKGILDAGHRIWETLKSIVEQAWDNLMRNLGIRSPSRVYAWAGEQMMAGLARGIWSGAALPQTALENALLRVTPRVTQMQTGGDRFTFGDIVINEAQHLEPVDLARAVLDEAGRRADSRRRLRA